MHSSLYFSSNSQTNIISHSSDVEDGVKIWTVEIEGETTNIVLCKYFIPPSFSATYRSEKGRCGDAMGW